MSRPTSGAQQALGAGKQGIKLSAEAGDYFDSDIYGGKGEFVDSIPTLMEDDDVPEEPTGRKKLPSFTAPRNIIEEAQRAGGAEDDASFLINQGRARTVGEQESEYQRRRYNLRLSPEHEDPFSEKTPNPHARSYNDVLKEANLAKEEKRVKDAIRKKLREEDERDTALQSLSQEERDRLNLSEEPDRKRQRTMMDQDVKPTIKIETAPSALASTPSVLGMTPSRRSRWDIGPGTGSLAETPKRSKWDERTPSSASALNATPVYSGASGVASTPAGDFGMQTPNVSSLSAAHALNMTPEQYNRLAKELDERNKPWSEEELDAILPSEGYVILKPPPDYEPPIRKLTSTPAPLLSDTGFVIQEEQRTMSDFGLIETPEGLPNIKPEDEIFFAKLLANVDETQLSMDELKERKILRLLLKVKNGTPPQRKHSLRQLTDRAQEFGPSALFNQILPLLMSPSLEPQERHLLVKVVDRILYKLDDQVRPFVHKILIVIEPLLIDKDYYARVEGREIISNLAKAAGLASMIATMRHDIDHQDEYVRNTTARAFSVVASALGIPAMMPFLKAVCQSKKSWEARHTGVKIVQQIAILVGCAVVPHLTDLVQIIQHGLEDEQQKVRAMTAFALAALAEAACPYGIESFDCVLKPLWLGIQHHRGKTLVAFLKAIGFIISLMDANAAGFYTKRVMPIIVREFPNPEEDVKKIVLKVLKQTVATEGIEPPFVKSAILPEFFKNFWVRKMAVDPRNYRQVIETTVEIANKVGSAEIVERLVNALKDESEPFRKMAIETIEKVVTAHGVTEINQRLEELLVDGMITAFHDQNTDDPNRVILNGFGTIINSLGLRAKRYLPQICNTIKFKLIHRVSKVRQHAADLIARIAVVMKTCDEERLMAHLGVVLYENLGEEYPETLGSVLGALKAIVNVIGMPKMTPPIKDLLPRLTPILKNRHEKVQENCIDLVGRIADRGSEYVSAREWMRICFELLEMLKAHKKGIRRAAVNTFGYIAKAIGPQDVLHTLLNNLRVQERQNRVCTTVAIAIVAETCAPFTVLPALMNEYRVPELNVQNGVLKALSFVFEYIGEMGKDYIYAITPLLEDALIDRDLVHRQTACTVVKHMALGVQALGCEDAMMHLLNHVWPNVFETSPHVINAVVDAIEGLRVALGPATILLYALQGLFHPARKVRTIFWKIFNNLYIGAQDALVAVYPRVQNDENLTCHELEYFL